MENFKMLDGFLTKSQHKSLKSLFRRSSTEDDSPSSSSAANSPKPIPHLSPFANSVVSRCSKSLSLFLFIHLYMLYFACIFFSMRWHSTCPLRIALATSR
ncbi:hypothetical protein RchiOBHm_Chr4g0447171 [Rosa chinensis]|uniref:Uncharacterized protein n=1 Tax=Rosa chinensis TaxID=74649 RepID=A0A2P6R4W8_ROSCH|nr:hypothetical protein RchiOBHm_Chr4g0447171 [Rosa chinensis]